jgi:hypothetical protein
MKNFGKLLLQAKLVENSISNGRFHRPTEPVEVSEFFIFSQTTCKFLRNHLFGPKFQGALRVAELISYKIIKGETPYQLIIGTSS